MRLLQWQRFYMEVVGFTFSCKSVEPLYMGLFGGKTPIYGGFKHSHYHVRTSFNAFTYL